jgi:putative membrane protein
VLSGLAPADRTDWIMEAAPVMAGILLLAFTERRHPLTPLVLRLLFLHALVLLLGAHYTYAKVPIGDWAAATFHFSRNHYDRFAHVVQGFVPALLAREILIRCTPLRRGAWLAFVVFCVALAFSAFYEITEWWTAVIGGGAADAYLGTQGDPFDTQEDMACAVVGALLAVLTMSRLHDRALARLRR